MFLKGKEIDYNYSQSLSLTFLSQSGYSQSAQATSSTSLPLRGILKQANPYPRLRSGGLS